MEKQKYPVCPHCRFPIKRKAVPDKRGRLWHPGCLAYTERRKHPRQKRI